MLCLLYGPALTTVRDHWEDHSLGYPNLTEPHCIFPQRSCLLTGLQVGEEAGKGKAAKVWAWGVFPLLSPHTNPCAGVG